MAYSEADLSQALINADKAGDADAARSIVAEIQKMRGAPATGPSFGSRVLQGVKDPLHGIAQLAAHSAPEGVARGAGDISSFFGNKPVSMGELDTKIAQDEQRYTAGRGADAGFDWARLLGNIGATAPLALMGGGGLPAAVATGAATGAAQPVHDAEDFWGKKALQTGIGAGSGLAGHLVAKGLGKVAGSIANRGTAPTTEALKKASGAAYDAADDAGVIIAKDSFKTVAKGIEKKMAEEGIDATMHPRAMAALNRLTGVDENVTLKGAEILRRVARNAAASNDASERRLASIMIDELDDYVGKLGPKDIVAGDAFKATGALNEARKLWSRGMKSDTIETLIERAEISAPNFSGSGYENALRTQFRSLAQNAKRMRGFTEAEQEAIKHVAKGGPVENVLRMLGKFAPTGVVSSALSGGAGYAVGGPVGAAALPMTGFAARRGATALTSGNARAALEMMQRGGPPPQLDPLLMKLIFGTGPLVQSSLTNTLAPRR